MKNQVISRRSVLTGMGAAGAGVVTAGLPRTALAAPISVGFIYVGPKDDYGYNQAHAQGAMAIKGLPGVKIFEEERVPETGEVEKTMESMINLDKASLLFPTSFGYYDPHVIKLAAKYPKITFLHCGGLWQASHPTNAGSYFGYIDEAQYLSGIVAGFTSKTKKLGFVAAKPIPQVLRNINAFTMAARSVDPTITTRVVFTGDWALPVKEAEATNSLVDQGVDVVTCHVDSPKVVVETAERRGIFTTGYHASQAVLAPKGYLTGAEWNWAKVYTDYAQLVMDGKKVSSLVRGGLKEGIVKTSAFGPAVGAAARAAADAARAKFMAGGFSIFKGPLMDNKGAVVIPAGKELAQTDFILEKMDYLVQGVV